MDSQIIKSIILVLVLGFIIGMQRSMIHIYKNDTSYFAGSRTFSFIALLGYLAGWIDGKIPGFALTLGIVVSIFIFGSYVFKVYENKHYGMTTQISALVTFLLGLMVWAGLKNYAVFIGVVMIIILEIKPRLKQLESHISQNDIHAVTLLLAMSFVVLPILPDKMIGPYHLFNPYKTWLMAVIIAGISFVGYVAIKVLGQKHGVFLTGAAGGLISSTAVSISLSELFHKQFNLINNYAGGVAIACSIMYLRVLFEAFVIDPSLAWKLSIAYLAAAISGLAFSYYLYKHSSSADIKFDNPAMSKNPLQLKEAINFGILFGIIYGAISLVQTHYGNLGVYVVSFFSGLTDVDAITLSLSQLAREGKLAEFASMYGIVIASITNSIVKLGIVLYLGGLRLGWKVAQFFILTIGFMLIGVYIAKILY